MSGSGRVDNGLWQPRSDCGPGCLPVPGESEVLPRNRQAGRLLGMLGVALLGVGLLPVLPVLNARGRHLAGRAWARTVLRVLGIRLVARGRLPQRRALLAANHISWLDIVAILAVSPSRMLAKHDVRGWPLFGALAAAAGTIFVDRTRPRQLPATVAQVATALRADGVVTVFPEGTTWCGAPRGSVDCGGSGRFRPAMFQAAVDAGAVVVPLIISYRTGVDREGATAAAFLGDETLWVSLRRVLAVRELVVSVTAAPALHPAAGADRRVLARVAESAVRMPWCGCQSGLWPAGRCAVADSRCIALSSVGHREGGCAMPGWTIDEPQRLTLTEPVDRLDVSLLSGRLNVVGADGPARIEVAQADHTTIIVEQRDGRLSVRQERAPRWAGLLWWLTAGWRQRVNVSIAVPTQARVDLRLVSGSVIVSGLRDNTRVDVTSGQVTLMGLTGRTAAKLVSGPVEALGVAGDLTMETVSGELVLADSPAERVHATTQSGSITCDLDNPRHSEIRLGATSGSVTVRVREDSDLTVHLRTTAGQITSAFPQLRPEGPNWSRESHGVLGAGDGKLWASSTSGSISLLSRPVDDDDPADEAPADDPAARS